MQKKKKVISSGKDKSVKKAVAKPIVKKAAKKLAHVKESKVIEKSKEQKIKTPVVATKPEKIKENKAALKQANQSTQKNDDDIDFTPTIDTKKLSPDQLENYKKWLKLHKQHHGEIAVEYKMTNEFEIKTPLKHKVHGWGIVMQRRDNYIDVLFEAGVKTLVCNYKT